MGREGSRRGDLRRHAGTGNGAGAASDLPNQIHQDIYSLVDRGLLLRRRRRRVNARHGNASRAFSVIASLPLLARLYIGLTYVLTPPPPPPQPPPLAPARA